VINVKCPQAAPESKVPGEAAAATANGNAPAVPSSAAPTAEQSHGAAARPSGSKEAPKGDGPISNGVAEAAATDAKVATGVEAGDVSPSRKKARREDPRASEAQPMDLDAAKTDGKDVL
jgi:hypothetical protein